MHQNLPINMIIGAGRSGTTWLGSIINTHPEVSYRFEPFHRLQGEIPGIENFVDVLTDPELTDDALRQVYDALVKADPLTKKPPFFKKNNSPNSGVQLTWFLSRIFRPAKIVYSSFYTPSNTSPLVIKEVSFEMYMKNLLANTSMPITYLVRHPCGNILSELRGQQTGNMSAHRQKYLGKLMKGHDPLLYERYGQSIDHMSPLEKTAWIWRISLEMGVEAIQSTKKGLLITYEQLCDDPYEYAKQVFHNFGLTYPQEAEQFIDQLYSTENEAKPTRHKDLMNGFFTVYRNPEKQKNAWKAKITREEQTIIENIVWPSPAFEYCAALGRWD
jgi:hypothetical protein